MDPSSVGGLVCMPATSGWRSRRRISVGTYLRVAYCCLVKVAVAACVQGLRATRLLRSRSSTVLHSPCTRTRVSLTPSFELHEVAVSPLSLDGLVVNCSGREGWSSTHSNPGITLCASAQSLRALYNRAPTQHKLLH